MKVSKNKVTLLSLAVAGLFAASAAQAVVNLNLATGATKYASEISITAATTLVTSANPAQVTLGFGFSAGQDRYVRFDLPAGVVWGAAITGGALSDFTTPLNLTSVVVSQGGTITDSYVVFQITAGAAVPFTDVLQFIIPSVKVTSAASVPLTYNLHETAISAANAVPTNTTRLIGPVAANILTFTPAINIVASTVPVETVAAISLLFKFCAPAAPAPNTGAPGTANCIATDTDLVGLIGAIAT